MRSDEYLKTYQPIIYKTFENALSNHLLSHAYLIETNNNSLDIVKKYILFLVERIYEDSYKNHDVTISKDKLFHLIENNEFPDYIETFDDYFSHNKASYFNMFYSNIQIIKNFY